VLRYGTAIRASIFASSHPLNLSMAPKECYDGADVVLRNQKFADSPVEELDSNLYGAFPVKSCFWFVGGSLFGAGKPFFVPSPAIRFAERAEGVKGPKR
jgi:hypothetical protein